MIRFGRMYLPIYSMVTGNQWEGMVHLVLVFVADLRTCLHPGIGMSYEVCSDCLISEQICASIESTTGILVSVILPSVEGKSGCCLDQMIRLPWFLWTLAHYLFRTVELTQKHQIRVFLLFVDLPGLIPSDRDLQHHHSLISSCHAFFCGL
ncbi:hypothetical protein Tco_0585225 [Tanacetum coccineum]